MSQAAQPTKIEDPENRPTTKYDHGDEIHTDFGRPYVVKHAYYSSGGSEMIHLRRKFGRHDMYVPISRLERFLRENGWTYHPQD